LYGLSVIAFYAVLGALALPSFYDKLLPVPILNLAIKLVDAAARSSLKWFDPAALGRTLLPRRRNLAYMSIWSVIFLVMSVTQGVGDTHRGHWLPFWQQACKDGRRNGCRNLALMEASYCKDGSGWACNEFGLLTELRWNGEADAAGLISPVSRRVNESFKRACDLGFSAACNNLRAVIAGSGSLRRAPPRLVDYPIVLLEGKGPILDRTPLALYQRACNQGWTAGCENLGILYLRGDGVPRDPERAIREFDKACRGGEPTACSNAGLMYRNGDGVVRDDNQALAYLTTACGLGMANACRWIANRPSKP